MNTLQDPGEKASTYPCRLQSALPRGEELLLKKQIDIFLNSSVVGDGTTLCSLTSILKKRKVALHHFPSCYYWSALKKIGKLLKPCA